MQFNQRHDYEYPNGLDLRPDSPVHEKLLDAAKDRIKRGYETGSDMREMWRNRPSPDCVCAHNQTLFGNWKDSRRWWMVSR